MVTHNPLHRSGRAGFPHPALASGDDATAAQRIGMTDAGRRQPAVNQPPHAVPGHAAVLAPTRERAMPEAADLKPKHVQRGAVHGHAVVTNVPTDNRAQPGADSRNGVVHASSEVGFDLAQLRLQSFANRLPYHREASIAPLLPADVREAEKVERLRLPFSASAPVVGRIAGRIPADAFSRDAIPGGTSESARSTPPRIVRRPL